MKRKVTLTATLWLDSREGNPVSLDALHQLLVSQVGHLADAIELDGYDDEITDVRFHDLHAEHLT